MLHVRTFLIIFRAADLIYDEKLDTVMRKIEITRSIASKIAYQWFGNAVLPTCWITYRLNNELATLFGEDTTVKVILYLLISQENKKFI